jgi:hypothetical protein
MILNDQTSHTYVEESVSQTALMIMRRMNTGSPIAKLNYLTMTRQEQYTKDLNVIVRAMSSPGYQNKLFEKSM